MPQIFPEFESPIPNGDEFFGGRSLSENLEKLDGILASRKLTTLSELIDARTMALEMFDEDELPDNCPPVQWYSRAGRIGNR